MARIAVQLIPRSRKNEIIRAEESLKVRVTAPPVDGAANEALITLLASHLNVPKRAVRIVQGRTSRHKIIEIENLTVEEITGKFPAPFHQ